MTTQDATSSSCRGMSEQGTTLTHNNEQIVKCLEELKKQRDEINLLVFKQRDEREMLMLEMERIKYKINLITKSLAQRLAARDKYDQTIREAEAYYQHLVDKSSILLGAVKKKAGVLEECIDKKCGNTQPIINQLPFIPPNRDATVPSKPKSSTTNPTEQVKLQKESVSHYIQLRQPIMLYESVEGVKEIEGAAKIEEYKEVERTKQMELAKQLEHVKQFEVVKQIENLLQTENIKPSISHEESIGTVSTIKSVNYKLHSSNTAIYPGTIYPEMSPSTLSYDTQ